VRLNPPLGASGRVSERGALLAAHDELRIEADKDHAAAAVDWLQTAVVDGMTR
jgi:hypothetical protein